MRSFINNRTSSNNHPCTHRTLTKISISLNGAEGNGDNDVARFFTGDIVQGVASVTPNVDLSFERIEITFSGKHTIMC